MTTNVIGTRLVHVLAADTAWIIAEGIIRNDKFKCKHQSVFKAGLSAHLLKHPDILKLVCPKTGMTLLDVALDALNYPAIRQLLLFGVKIGETLPATIVNILYNSQRDVLKKCTPPQTVVVISDPNVVQVKPPEISHPVSTETLSHLIEDGVPKGDGVGPMCTRKSMTFAWYLWKGYCSESKKDNFSMSTTPVHPTLWVEKRVYMPASGTHVDGIECLLEKAIHEKCITALYLLLVYGAKYVTCATFRRSNDPYRTEWQHYETYNNNNIGVDKLNVKTFESVGRYEPTI